MNDRLDQLHWSVTLPALAENGEPMSWNLFLALIPLALSTVLFYPPKSPIVRWGIWLLLGMTAAGSYSRLQAIAQTVMQRFGDSQWAWLGAILLSIGLIIAYSYRQQPRLRSLLWGLGVGVFLAFLPNAAYILTDVIHLVIDIRKGYPMGTILLFLLPQYLLFIVVGFEAYVVSILHLEFDLLQRGLGHTIIWVELGLNGLTAIGVYLGRFARLNSWDLLTHPAHLVHQLQTLVSSHHALVVIAVLWLIFTAFHRLFKRITLGLMRQKQAFQAL